MPFLDSFNAAIYGNDSLSNVDKFNYLCSLLKGTELYTHLWAQSHILKLQESRHSLTEAFWQQDIDCTKVQMHYFTLCHIFSSQHQRDFTICMTLLGSMSGVESHCELNLSHMVD